MKTYRRLTLNAVALIAISASLIFVAPSDMVQAASSDTCSVRLGVVLMPDVPNPLDEGFLSSLLSNHPGFQLTLQRLDGGAILVLELSGPGPEYSCMNVIETMRRDARVLSVDVQGASS